uniref:Uncharacterized protein n=1 Tax=Picea glauca TaxID=3330 RepID=A0A101M143_PICGL|nr:hypothetical protein ABT39_MTgene4412 [Picea glauca]QHR86236.1 hypothetical protein Q903MT_gene235 [Picea sitchensis]
MPEMPEPTGEKSRKRYARANGRRSTKSTNMNHLRWSLMMKPKPFYFIGGTHPLYLTHESLWQSSSTRCQPIHSVLVTVIIVSLS